MVKDIIEEIGKKIEVSITIMIFLTVVFKAYFEINSNADAANTIFVAFSVFVAFYIISYGLYSWFKESMDSTRRIEKWMNFFLNLNFIFVGIVTILVMLALTGEFNSGFKGFFTSILFIVSFSIITVVPALIMWILTVITAFKKNENDTNSEVYAFEETPPENIKPAWKKILLLFYKTEPTWRYYGRGKQIDESHPLTKILGVSSIKANAAISFLQVQKLIIEEGKKFVLTEKGLNVAMDIEKHNDNSKFQVILIVFTMLLFFNGVVTIVDKHLTGSGLERFMFFIYLGIVLALVIIGYEINKRYVS